MQKCTPGDSLISVRLCVLTINHAKEKDLPATHTLLVVVFNVRLGLVVILTATIYSLTQTLVIVDMSTSIR